MNRCSHHPQNESLQQVHDVRFIAQQTGGAAIHSQVIGQRLGLHHCRLLQHWSKDVVPRLLKPHHSRHHAPAAHPHAKLHLSRIQAVRSQHAVSIHSVGYGLCHLNQLAHNQQLVLLRHAAQQQHHDVRIPNRVHLKRNRHGLLILGRGLEHLVQVVFGSDGLGLELRKRAVHDAPDVVQQVHHRHRPKLLRDFREAHHVDGQHRRLVVVRVDPRHAQVAVIQGLARGHHLLLARHHKAARPEARDEIQQHLQHLVLFQLELVGELPHAPRRHAGVAVRDERAHQHHAVHHRRGEGSRPGRCGEGVRHRQRAQHRQPQPPLVVEAVAHGAHRHGNSEERADDGGAGGGGGQEPPGGEGGARALDHGGEVLGPRPATLRIVCLVSEEGLEANEGEQARYRHAHRRRVPRGVPVKLAHQQHRQEGHVDHRSGNHHEVRHLNEVGAVRDAEEGLHLRVLVAPVQKVQPPHALRQKRPRVRVLGPHAGRGEAEHEAQVAAVHRLKRRPHRGPLRFRVRPAPRPSLHEERLHHALALDGHGAPRNQRFVELLVPAQKLARRRAHLNASLGGGLRHARGGVHGVPKEAEEAALQPRDAAHNRARVQPHLEVQHVARRGAARRGCVQHLLRQLHHARCLLRGEIGGVGGRPVRAVLDVGGGDDVVFAHVLHLEEPPALHQEVEAREQRAHQLQELLRLVDGHHIVLAETAEHEGDVRVGLNQELRDHRAFSVPVDLLVQQQEPLWHHLDHRRLQTRVVHGHLHHLDHVQPQALVAEVARHQSERLHKQQAGDAEGARLLHRAPPPLPRRHLRQAQHSPQRVGAHGVLEGEPHVGVEQEQESAPRHPRLHRRAPPAVARSGARRPAGVHRVVERVVRGKELRDGLQAQHRHSARGCAQRLVPVLQRPPSSCRQVHHPHGRRRHRQEARHAPHGRHPHLRHRHELGGVIVQVRLQIYRKRRLGQSSHGDDAGLGVGLHLAQAHPVRGLHALVDELQPRSLLEAVRRVAGPGHGVGQVAVAGEGDARLGHVRVPNLQAQAAAPHRLHHLRRLRRQPLRVRLGACPGAGHVRQPELQERLPVVNGALVAAAPQVFVHARLKRSAPG
mmetsp:Transcript_29862/g.56298  ORF Transcript_29862/g.56298 Transcript_29862/m.56298 type:complete len:1095 (+) Transcript_29862:449-3733(+)